MLRPVHFLASKLPLKRNPMLKISVFDVIDTSMSTTNKFIREHSARLEDVFVTRRQFLQRAGMGFGALSLAALLGEETLRGTSHAETPDNLLPRAPHFAAKAKHVVHIFAQ